ncbi:MAG TPA: hypothetical protein VII69_00020 [Candidatus Eremiobacteraceae bacterium]
MSDDKGPSDQVFLVRMWPAQPTATRHTWRGSVQHVATGRKLYISGLADVIEFISGELSDLTAEAHSEPS